MCRVGVRQGYLDSITGLEGVQETTALAVLSNRLRIIVDSSQKLPVNWTVTIAWILVF